MAKRTAPNIPSVEGRPDADLDFTGTPYEEKGRADEMTPGGEFLTWAGNRLVRINAKGERLDPPDTESENPIPPTE